MRTRAAADAVKFTVDQTKVKKTLGTNNSLNALTPKPVTAAIKADVVISETDAQREAEMAKLVCSLENKENCMMCSG
jgi:hypothetical protein